MISSREKIAVGYILLVGFWDMASCDVDVGTHYIFNGRRVAQNLKNKISLIQVRSILLVKQFPP